MSDSKQYNCKIEKSVPFYPTKRGVKLKYPFDKMEIGDSFISDKNCVLSGNNWAARKGNGYKFVSSVEGNGYRIWRIDNLQ